MASAETGNSFVGNGGEFSSVADRRQRKQARGRLMLTAATTLLLCAFLAACGGNFFLGPTLSTLYINPASATIAPNNTAQLGAIGIYSDGSQSAVSGESVTWSSSDPTIATVSSPGGLVTGVSAGSAVITATATVTVPGTGCRAVVTTSPSIQIQKVCTSNSTETLTSTVNLNVTTP